MKSPFLCSIEEEMRSKRYAKRTIESYIRWIKAFIYFNNKQHPIQRHKKVYLSPLLTRLTIIKLQITQLFI